MHRDAQWLVVTIPEAFEAGQVVEHARTADRSLEILARVLLDAAVAQFDPLGADLVVGGEREIAKRMLERMRR